jgi:hypothetical protein
VPHLIYMPEEMGRAEIVPATAIEAGSHHARRFWCGCMTGSCVGDVSGENFFELVERADPSVLMAFACGRIEQLLVT